MTARQQPAIVEAVLNRSYASRRAVIEAIGSVMLKSAAITPAYVDGMLRKEEEGCTIVTDEIALPHGTHDVRHAVLRNALVIVPIPGGIDWAPGRRVRLAIGFAGTGDDAHLRLMSEIARVLSNASLVAHLKAATQSDDLTGVIRELER